MGVEVFYLVAAVWIVAIAIVIGLTGLLVSFSKHRHGCIVMVCSLVAMLTGMLFTFFLYRERDPSVSSLAYFLCAAPFIFGVAALTRWLKLKTCPKCQKVLGLGLQLGIASPEMCGHCKVRLVPSHEQRILLAFGVLFGLLSLLKGSAMVNSLAERGYIVAIVILCAFGLVPGPRIQGESKLT